ncbi:hypothetical protein RHDC4_00161 [Rhodocyclaceae bacterium]|nr:hypothetical protein RHDC4_00161 [Rhodocyclaceae bacterium]
MVSVVEEYQFEVVRSVQSGRVAISVNPDVPVFVGSTVRLVGLDLELRMQGVPVGRFSALPDWAVSRIASERGAQFLVCAPEGVIEHPFLGLEA